MPSSLKIGIGEWNFHRFETICTRQVDTAIPWFCLSVKVLLQTLQNINAILSETQFTFCISAFMKTTYYFNYRSNIYFSSCRLDLINKWIDNWTESKWLFEILNLTERIQTKNRKFVITSDMNPVEEVFRTVFDIEK